MGCLSVLLWHGRHLRNPNISLFGRKVQLRLCHAMPSRSFKIGHYHFPICSRCTGLLVGMVFGMVLLEVLDASLFGFFLMVPLMVDGISQLKGQRESTNTLRFVTGILFSIGSFFFMGVIR